MNATPTFCPNSVYKDDRHDFHEPEIVIEYQGVSLMPKSKVMFCWQCKHLVVFRNSKPVHVIDTQELLKEEG